MAKESQFVVILSCSHCGNEELFREKSIESIEKRAEKRWTRYAKIDGQSIHKKPVPCLINKTALCLNCYIELLQDQNPQL